MNDEQKTSVLSYIHTDDKGNQTRRCIKGHDGIWRHFDHEQPEPGPRERRSYTCDWEHDGGRVLAGTLITKEDYAELLGCRVVDIWPDEDRGDFGMPALGSKISTMLSSMGIKVGDLTISSSPASQPLLPEYTMVVRPDGVSFDFGEKGLDEDFFTTEARVIFDLLPDVLVKFLESNEKYSRAQTGHDLGLKGIIPDINRKVSVLVSRLWFDEPEAGREPTEVIIEDIIGHLLLMLGKMRLEDGGGTSANG